MDLNNQCYCCLLRPPDKLLKTPYTRLGITEIYSAMLEECFNLQLLDSDDQCGICEVCVGRLRDASDFKLQVQRSQVELLVWAEKESWHKGETPVKTEPTEDDLWAELSEFNHDVKLEAVDPLPECDDAGGTRWKSTMDHEVETDSLLDYKKEDEKPAQTVCQVTPEPDSFLTSFETNTDLNVEPLKHNVVDDLIVPTKRPKKKKKLPLQSHDDVNNIIVSTKIPKNRNVAPESIKAYVSKKVKWPLSCRSCSKVFKNKDQFDRHTVSHTGEKLYVCGWCHRQFIRKPLLIKHIEIHRNRYQCRTCDQTFIGFKTLQRHRSTHPQDFTCYVCKKQYKSSSGLRHHKRAHFKGEFHCSICDKRFSSKDSFQKHKPTHAGEVLYACEICSLEFRHTNELRLHKCAIKNKPYSCEICSKQFASISFLKKHKENHLRLEQNKFFCEICGKQFANKSCFNDHLLIHKNGKPYACDMCPKRFSTKCGIVEHARLHTGLNIYTCEVCSRKFTCISKLKRHKLIHSDEPPKHVCEICDKRFRYKQHLKAHTMIHTGHKPYSCEICFKCFRDSTNLKTHLEIHAEGIVYTCELCPKTYSTKNGLRQHKRTHTAKKNGKTKKT